MPELTHRTPLHLCPLGDSAVVLQFGDEINLETHYRLRAVTQALEQRPFPGLVEFVPAYTTLTVYYDPWELSQHGKTDAYAEVVRQLEVLVELAAHFEPSPARLVELPVVYGGAYGPDLEEVATHAGLPTDEVVRLHSSGSYQVYMIGFTPGFPYLGGMDDRIATPRKTNPRTSIPAGSVGIAGAQTGVYSLSTPGGWQLIGRTPLTLFDPDRETPSLLQAGDEVRFIPISEEEYLERKEGQA
ncbi:5-oxoprolinase subunit PxpB [Pontibacter mangrovi]|uniref:5-oxoprolinase subunit PxpB n=1 Tax=Pontibacter mangrovi TaxID=2589816 RepID=A0A501WA97_9BACT|nr:5-oxoprolinase subunit PxpB [Pontibacter mangrovi]TPE46318.1 5-oxoprolinase subunit PxpB [Pontibacter mangrovi]